MRFSRSHVPPATRSAAWLLALILAATLILPAPSAEAAPPYAVSGRADELAAVVIAPQSPAGPITALDVLIFDQMTSRGLAAMPMLGFANPATASPAQRAAMRRSAATLAAVASIAAEASDWQPAADIVEVLSFGAAEAVWVKNVIQPQVQVMPADINRYYLANPQFYLRQRRADVREIFVPAGTPEAMLDAEQALEAIGEQVRAGALTFEDAAREHSKAASAAQGGAVPTVTERTLFPEYLSQAFALDEPGQLSRPFRGPGGVYMLQLVKPYEPANTPVEQVAGQIRDYLAHNHIPYYYRAVLAEKLRKVVAVNKAPYWDYQEEQAPIAYVGNLKLRRQDLMRFYGNATTPDYESNATLINGAAADWIEGQVVMRELRAAGQADHAWIARARELATFRLRAQRALARQIPAEAYASNEAAMAVLQDTPGIRDRMRAARLVQFTLSDETDEADMAGKRREARNLLREIDEQLQAGVLTVETRPINLREWIAPVTAAAEPDWKAAIKQLESAAEETTWEDVSLKVTDAGWQPAVPGSGWDLVLGAATPGTVSTQQLLGNKIVRYLVVATRPIEPGEYQERPLFLRTLAFQALGSKQIDARREQLEAQGALTFAQ